MERDGKSFYKYCMVPKCKNTIKSAPDKKYFSVPRNANIRHKWCKAMRRDEVSSKSCLYCCEDHFNVKEDTQNYTQHVTMAMQGVRVILRLKKGVVPHKFECQQKTKPIQREDTSQKQMVNVRKPHILKRGSLKSHSQKQALEAQKSRSHMRVSDARKSQNRKRLISVQDSQSQERALELQESFSQNQVLTHLSQYVSLYNLGGNPVSDFGDSQTSVLESAEEISPPAWVQNIEVEVVKCEDLSDEEQLLEQSQDAPVRLVGSGTSQETKEKQIVENIEPFRRDDKSGHSSSTETALSEHEESTTNEKTRTKITRMKKEYFNLTKEETEKFLYMKEKPKKDSPVCKEQIEYAMIASVYHYLQKEYEYMKSYVGESCDLSPLANVVQRTADATGTCVQIVTAILKAERFQKNINSAVPANKTVVWLDHDYHIHDLRKRQRISRPKRGKAACSNVNENADESSCDSLDHLYTDQLPVVAPTKPKTATSSSGVVVGDYNRNRTDYLQSNHKEEEAADYDENLIMKCEVFEHTLLPQYERPHDEVEPAASNAKRRKVKIEREYDEYQQSSSTDHAHCLPHTTQVKIETSSDECTELSERDPLKYDSTTNSLLVPAPQKLKAQAERQRKYKIRQNQKALNNPERRKRTPKNKTESQRKYKLKKRTKKVQNNSDEPTKNCYQREYKTRKKDRELNSASARVMQEGPSTHSFC